MGGASEGRRGPVAGRRCAAAAAAAFLVAAFALLLAAAVSAEATGYWAANVPNYRGTTGDDATVTLVNRGGDVETVTVHDAAGPLAALTVPAWDTVTYTLTDQLMETQRTDRGSFFFDAPEMVVATLHAPVDLMPPGGRSNDATRLLPESSLGTEHRVASHNDEGRHDNHAGDFVTVVATRNDTRVEIQVTAPTLADGNVPPQVPAMVPGSTYVFFLDRFEVLNIRSEAGDELVGSRVSSDRPVAVFSGNECTYVWEDPTLTGPSGQCDLLLHQVPPSPLAGTQFVLCASTLVRDDGGPSPPGFDRVRVVATQGGTTNVALSNGATYTIAGGAGAWIQFDTTVSLGIAADRPVHVAQFFGRNHTQDTGDPAMLLLTPLHRHVLEHSFFVPETWPEQHIAVAAPAGTGAHLFGTPLNAAWDPIPNTGYGCLSRPVPSGTHHLFTDHPTSVWVLGIASPATYWFLADDPPLERLIRLEPEWEPLPVCHNTPGRMHLEATPALEWDPVTATYWSMGDGASYFHQPPRDSFEHVYREPGNYTATVWATDRAGRTSTAQVNVTAVNCPPVLDPIPDQVMFETETLVFRVTASDPNMDPVWFGMERGPLPENARFDGTMGEFRFTAPKGSAGDYHPVRFWVQDVPYGLRDAQNITITVLPLENLPPPDSFDSSGDGAPDHASDCPHRSMQPSCEDEVPPAASNGEGDAGDGVPAAPADSGATPPDGAPPGGDPCVVERSRPSMVRAIPSVEGVRVEWRLDDDCVGGRFLVWMGPGTHLVATVNMEPGRSGYEAVELDPWQDRVHRYHVQGVPADVLPRFEEAWAVASNPVDLRDCPQEECPFMAPPPPPEPVPQEEASGGGMAQRGGWLLLLAVVGAGGGFLVAWARRHRGGHGGDDG